MKENTEDHYIGEYISHEPGDADAWTCICGNTPPDSGFYPCDRRGNEMEPSISNEWNGLFVCSECGRVINQHTLEVIRRNPHFRRRGDGLG